MPGSVGMGWEGRKWVTKPDKSKFFLWEEELM